MNKSTPECCKSCATEVETDEKGTYSYGCKNLQCECHKEKEIEYGGCPKCGKHRINFLLDSGKYAKDMKCACICHQDIQEKLEKAVKHTGERFGRAIRRLGEEQDCTCMTCQGKRHYDNCTNCGHSKRGHNSIAMRPRCGI